MTGLLSWVAIASVLIYIASSNYNNTVQNETLDYGEEDSSNSQFLIPFNASVPPITDYGCNYVFDSDGIWYCPDCSSAQQGGCWNETDPFDNQTYTICEASSACSCSSFSNIYGFVPNTCQVRYFSDDDYPTIDIIGISFTYECVDLGSGDYGMNRTVYYNSTECGSDNGDFVSLNTTIYTESNDDMKYVCDGNDGPMCKISIDTFSSVNMSQNDTECVKDTPDELNRAYKLVENVCRVFSNQNDDTTTTDFPIFNTTMDNGTYYLKESVSSSFGLNSYGFVCGEGDRWLLLMFADKNCTEFINNTYIGYYLNSNETCWIDDELYVDLNCTYMDYNTTEMTEFNTTDQTTTDMTSTDATTTTEMTSTDITSTEMTSTEMTSTEMTTSETSTTEMTTTEMSTTEMSTTEMNTTEMSSTEYNMTTTDILGSNTALVSAFYALLVGFLALIFS